ncbi:MAG: DUF4173 domain-containing protein [Clostridiales bacterium]|nr:DUF4173 domain-containing protein [Clostridiales bacterium]
MSKYFRALAASVIGAFAVVEFVFFSYGFSAFNATVFYFSLLLAFFLAIGFPQSGAKNRTLQFVLMGAIVALSACFTLFDNRGLDFLNGAVILFLMGILCLQRIGEERVAIGEKGFLKELLLGYILRPLLSIPDPFKEASELSKAKRNIADGTANSAPTRRSGLSTVVQIIIALAVGLPLLIVLTVLLASSDAVFADWLGDLIQFLDARFVTDVLFRLFLFVPVVPFVMSTIFSYKNKRFYSNNGGASGSTQAMLIPEVSAITILALVNALYLVFAVVQSVYMFGAWAGELPEGLTYAEYARSGFFELAFVSVINAIMILVSIRYTKRRERAGTTVRVLSMILIALSFVQLASAFRRMALYIEAYGLSEDRYLVSGFMILMGVLFILLAVREFFEKLPLFKSALLAGVLALLLINFSVPGYWIASHNIDRYLSGDLDMLDADYLMRNSSDSLLVLLEREDELREEEDDRIEKDLDQIDKFVSSRYIKEADDEDGLFGNRYSSYNKVIDTTWRSFNVSSYRVLMATEETRRD